MIVGKAYWHILDIKPWDTTLLSASADRLLYESQTPDVKQTGYTNLSTGLLIRGFLCDLNLRFEILVATKRAR